MVEKAPQAHMRARTATPAHAKGVSFACLLVALCVASVAPAQANKPVVHVFLQLDAKSGALEKMLQQEFSALGVTVFSRYRDLEDAAAGNPDALLAITPVLQQRGKEPVLQGTRGGKDTEPYLLVAIGTVLDGSLSGKTIGAVDVMGRDGTQAFVAALVKTNDIKVKRVAKTEDLLPLLEFSAVDGVLIPSSAFGRLAERTRLAIKSKEVPGGAVGLPALAVFNAGSKEMIVKSLLSMDATVKRVLGIDSWSVR